MDSSMFMIWVERKAIQESFFLSMDHNVQQICIYAQYVLREFYSSKKILSIWVIAILVPMRKFACRFNLAGFIYYWLYLALVEDAHKCIVPLTLLCSSLTIQRCEKKWSNVWLVISFSWMVTPLSQRQLSWNLTIGQRKID